MDSVDEAATWRATLNDELGFYPANLDDESIAGDRRSTAEQAERLARYDRKYGSPGGSHYNQFKHLRQKVGSPRVGEGKPSGA